MIGLRTPALSGSREDALQRLNGKQEHERIEGIALAQASSEVERQSGCAIQNDHGGSGGKRYCNKVTISLAKTRVAKYLE